MLAGLKTLCSGCVARPAAPYKYRQGFFADMLNNVLTCLPEYLWQAKRHKRSYVNQVLARAEFHSAYQPARRLWVRTVNGHYLPNPLMQLRAQARSDASAWRPVFDVLNLPWVCEGTDSPQLYGKKLKSVVEAAQRRAEGGHTEALADGGNAET